MRITSPATKSDALTYQAVFTLWQLRIFFLPCFQSLKCLCHSLAHRGQPCIMSALTAMQLYRIQSLDRSKQKPWRTVHRVCFWESDIFNTEQIKLRITSPCRSTSIYSLNLLYCVKPDFWRCSCCSCLIRLSVTCLKLYVRPGTCLVLRHVPKCGRQRLDSRYLIHTQSIRSPLSRGSHSPLLVWQLYFNSRCSSIDVSLLILIEDFFFLCSSVKLLLYFWGNNPKIN